MSIIPIIYQAACFKVKLPNELGRYIILLLIVIILININSISDIIIFLFNLLCISSPNFSMEKSNKNINFSYIKLRRML